MKKSINIGVIGNRDFKDGLKIIKDAGFEAVELNYIEEMGSRRYVEDLRETVSKAGLEIASLLTGQFWKFPLTSDDTEKRKKGEEILAKSIDICETLGTDALLVVPGVVGTLWSAEERVRYDIAYKRAQESIKKAIPLAEEKKVYICVENVWNKFLLSPIEMKRFVEEIESEYIGVYFDVGNILIIGYPEDWIRILGKKIKRIHLKDFKTSVGNIGGFCDLLEGDTNWNEVIKALKEVGYDSYLTAEIGPYKQFPETVIYNTSLAIDKILGIK
ncbi:MAG: sugar phosphate isomerase/epimerase [Candidatus Omnitrophica bacterium]|nr:sugar phosphate isomerase/epimerase [Candidatus Omnitrophota bacterium]